MNSKTDGRTHIPAEDVFREKKMEEVKEDTRGNHRMNDSERMRNDG